jgi:hypothetical protein
VGFEVGDFFFADGVVELAEVAEAGEFVEELGLHGGGGGFGEFLGAFAGDFLGATEHFGDDLVLDGRLIEEALGAATDEGGVVEFGLVGDVFEGVVDDDADGGGGEEAVDVEGGGGGAFGDVNALDEEAVGFGAAPDGEGGVALFAAEEEIEGAADEGVVGGEEGELLTRQGAGAVEGDGEAFFGQGGEGVGDEFAAMEEVVAVGEFFDMESEEVEHLNEEGFEVAVFVSGAEVVEEFVDLGGRAGAEFEEAVLTASETGLEFLVRGGGFFDEGGEVFFGEAVGEDGDFGGEGGLNFGGAVDGGFEGIEALVIPESEGFGAGAGEVGNVDVDGGGLADAVEAADALLEEFDVAGEVEEDEVVGELEVAAFAADFGADEEADAFGVGEGGGVAVALEKGQTFVEKFAVNVDLLLDALADEGGQFGAVADGEDFFGFAEVAQEAGEPDGEGLEGVFGREEFFVEGSEQEFALGEAGEDAAGVAEHDAAGAEFVDEVGDEGVASGVVAGLEGFEVALNAFGFFGEELFVGGTEFAGVEDAVDGLGDFLVVGGFLDEVGEVGVAVGVEEAEAGEVAVGAELLGSGGKEEKALDFGGELFDDLVFGAGLVGVPLEVVGFVNDEEIPAGFEDLGGAGFGGGEEGEAGEDELGIQEGVDAFVVVFDGLAAVLVKEAEEEIEAAEEFDKPLMEEGVGDKDEDAGGAAGELEAMEDEAGLDGFAEADFVCEQDAGEEAAGDFTGDGHLMRDQVNAAAEEATGGGATEGAAAFEGAEAEFEGAGVVDLTGEEAVLRFAETDGV